MVFVWTHYTRDLVTPGALVVARNAGPKAGDFKDHLRAVEGHELAIAREHEILPGVVDDGGIDVALPATEVRSPRTGARIEMNLLGFLAPVTAALPWIHGTAVTFLVRQTASSL